MDELTTCIWLLLPDLTGNCSNRLRENAENTVCLNCHAVAYVMDCKCPASSESANMGFQLGASHDLQISRVEQSCSQAFHAGTAIVFCVLLQDLKRSVPRSASVSPGTRLGHLQ